MKAINSRTWSPKFMELMSDFERELYDIWVNTHLYECWSSKSTIVIIKLHSGFEIHGYAGCEDPSKFDEELGHIYALKDALRKLGEFTAFYRAEHAIRKDEKAEEPKIHPPTYADVQRMINEAIKEHTKYRH